MKKHVSLSLVLVLVFLAGCQPPVVFENPQPADVKALDAFPKRIQGKYLSAEDNSILNVTANSLIRIYDFDEKVHLSQLDSNQQLIGDTLFDTKSNTGILVVIEGDSIVRHVSYMDTLFTINAFNILKKFKGYYFVNISSTADTWQVKKLELKRGALTLSDINTKEDIDQLKTLTESTQDTTPYVFSPTRKQFRDFVVHEGFRDSEMFMKVKD